MSASLGHNSSDSWSTQTSSGYQQSQSQSLAQSAQDAASQGTSGSMSSSSQDIAFKDLFQQLYGGATGAANNALVTAPQLTDVAKQLFTGGSNFLQGLGGDAGTAYETSRLTGPDVGLEAQLQELGTTTSDFFNNQILPGITARGVSSGNLGGSREGVAQGLAAKEAAKAYSTGAATLISNSQAQRDQIAAQVAANSLTSAQTGLSSLPSLFDLMTSGNNAELGVYSTLASILGGPTVLGQSQSSATSQNTSTSTARSLAEAIAQSFGTQTSYGRSRGTSSGWNASGGLISS